MAAVFANHDVCVFPSLVEGMPLTLLEAMAAGMPVVTTNVCGMADIVEDGVNGILTVPGDAQSLAAAVERLHHSTDLRRRLGVAAQCSMRGYTWKKVTRKLEEILCLAAQDGKN